MSIHVGNLDYEVGQNDLKQVFQNMELLIAFNCLRTGKQVESEVWPL